MSDAVACTNDIEKLKLSPSQAVRRGVGRPHSRQACQRHLETDGSKPPRISCRRKKEEQRSAFSSTNAAASASKKKARQIPRRRQFTPTFLSFVDTAFSRFVFYLFASISFSPLSREGAFFSRFVRLRISVFGPLYKKKSFFLCRATLREF